MSLCTLQLHFPVRSAQAHTALSRSQVSLSDPATSHSHWVHCGKHADTPRCCYQQHNRLREEPAQCVQAFMLHQTIKLHSKMNMLPLSSYFCVSGNITEVQTNTKHRVRLSFPLDWSLRDPKSVRKFIYLNRFPQFFIALLFMNDISQFLE